MVKPRRTDFDGKVVGCRAAVSEMLPAVEHIGADAGRAIVAGYMPSKPVWKAIDCNVPHDRRLRKSDLRWGTCQRLGKYY